MQDVVAPDDGYPFYVCLSHDVDRVEKTFQAPYYALTERRVGHLRDLVSDNQPYWQFQRILDIESELGVRSTFFFLNERPLWSLPVSQWLVPRNWVLYSDRYDVREEAIVETIRTLEEGGWEVGLHGSYDSSEDSAMLSREKRILESVTDEDVRGIRQHHLRLTQPTTWEAQRSIGLTYDSSLGSNWEAGFHGQHLPVRPFDDSFVVFPLTLMDAHLARSTPPSESLHSAWKQCRALLEEAADNGAVLTVNWHQRTFSRRDYPGFTGLYKRLIETAREMGAWTGPIADLYDRLNQR